MTREQFIEEARKLHYSEKDIEEMVKEAEAYNIPFVIIPLMEQKTTY